jgi:hypothetical protein
LTEETATAVKNIAVRESDKPFFLMGFSLGGNYALRIALSRVRTPFQSPSRYGREPRPRPFKATLTIDGTWPIYRYYFC